MCCGQHLCACLFALCSWVPSFEWLHTAVSGYWSSVVACDVCSAYGKERMYFYMCVGRSELHHSESRPTNCALLGVFVPACVWVSAWVSLACLPPSVCVYVCVGLFWLRYASPLCAAARWRCLWRSAGQRLETQPCVFPSFSLLLKAIKPCRTSQAFIYY